MAAHSYYNGGYNNNPPAYEQAFPHTEPVDRVSPVSQGHGYTSNSGHPYATNDYGSQNPRHSQQSFASDQGAYVAGGRFNEADIYSDNIPLKAHNQDPNGASPPWMQQPTQYAPEPSAMEPAGPPVAAMRRQKKGIFKKKLAWVTYTFTTVQLIVFIVELVKNGMFFHVLSAGGHPTDFCSSIYRKPDPTPPPVQPDDRPFAVRSDQHGSAIHPVYEECGQDSEFGGGVSVPMS
jgi:hypothetical protein